MTWREELRKVTIGARTLVGASFRGVSFFVESVESGGGRRAVVHEFPLRDEPYGEDLGRKARTFRVEGYVLGDDYLTQRDKLLVALEAEGPGELVHPYRSSSLKVICLSVSVRESRDAGGIATFALEFTETPLQAPAPVEVVDSAAQVATSADAALVATKAEFVERYDDEDLPAFAFESAETALVEAAASLEAALAPIVTATQELAEFSGNIAALTARAASLVRTPGEVLEEFGGAISSLVETVEAVPGALMDALIETYLAELETPVIATTTTRARELANQAAIAAALRRVIAIEAARIVPLVSYVSIDEAMAARDAIGAMLEEQAALAGDTAYPALVDLRSQVLRAVPGGQSLASVVTVTRNVPVPSLVLTHQLYGSVDREADLLARNGIRHPGFVAGELQVLSDE